MKLGDYNPEECEQCSMREKKSFGFGWIEYKCGHIEYFNPTEW